MEQINFDEYLRQKRKIFESCSSCVCTSCLRFQSGRCPYGNCYDDRRAVENPYNEAHPGQIRKTWSAWNQPGEQGHWCRGGGFYPVSCCRDFVKYSGREVKDCLKAAVQIFQDGYIDCPIIESIGCEQCYREFQKKGE